MSVASRRLRYVPTMTSSRTIGCMLAYPIRVVPAWLSFRITTYLGLCTPTGPPVWHSSDSMGSSQPDCLSVSSRYATDQFVLGVPLGHRRPDFVPTGSHVARVGNVPSLVILQKQRRILWWLHKLILTVVNLCHDTRSYNIDSIKVTNGQVLLGIFNITNNFVGLCANKSAKRDITSEFKRI
uniref:Uncharacterized protein n=1 Tax=Cucumis melo TaxID=3656 RepID=A0A9I9EKK5_CUCME